MEQESIRKVDDFVWSKRVMREGFELKYISMMLKFSYTEKAIKISPIFHEGIE